MKTAIQILNELEDTYFAHVEIEVFGVDSAFELDEIVDLELETWYDLESSIDELEHAAVDTIRSYVWAREDLDRLEEYICRMKVLDFRYELRRVLNDLDIESA